MRQLTVRGSVVSLFVIDQRMPSMTGIEFLSQAIELQPDAKRVLLTAYADTDVAIKAINEIRLDHYILKPWDPPEERLYRSPTTCWPTGPPPSGRRSRGCGCWRAAGRRAGTSSATT